MPPLRRRRKRANGRVSGGVCGSGYRVVSRPHGRAASPHGPEDALRDRSVDLPNAADRDTQLLEAEFGERAKLIGVIRRPRSPTRGR